MQRLKQQIVKVAPLDVPVLLTGESGTGKELAAHAIHKLSPRRDATMVMVNAAALPATLVESELFGYEAGSFTGAERKGRKGKVEQADGGSLFFDEVGDMPAEVQVKLLRVLQDGTFQRVGGQRPAPLQFPPDQREQSQLRGDDRRRHLPARPVLPHRRRHRPAAGLARAARGHPAAGRAGAEQFAERHGSGRRRCRPTRWCSCKASAGQATCAS
jgi:hypothetical protein